MTVDTAEDVKKAVDPAAEANPWPQRLSSWKTFSQQLHDRGTKIEKRYEDERESTIDINSSAKKVNLFYSNTTVIKESLYNSLPKPEVNRMHKGEWDNEPARVAATIMERILSYEIRCANYFDPAIKAAILDRLVPGIGTAWVNFIPSTENVPEHISIDIVYWKDLLYEPQRCWEKVTWVGRKLYMSPDTAKQRWGDNAIDSVKEGKTPSTVEDSIKDGKVCIIQMWDKTAREVIHMTPCGTILESTDDPYKLRGFFPTPKPLIASPATRQFLPMQEYYMAQDQYLELDILYSRINLIIEAVRVAGVYNASMPSIPRMLSGNENNLIPVDNWAMFAEKGGVKGNIDWFPVEIIAQVLNHLVSTFSFIKNQLFEVTGMADIIRGSSNQYETLGAQQIKAQFASVRMNGFQRDVSFFVRDILRIMAEVMCHLYSDEKMSESCGQLPQADQQFVQSALALLRNNYQAKYSIDIEADSLTQADWGMEQQQRLTYVTSLSQFLTAAVPAAESNPAIAPLLVQIIKFASVGFKGSNELEGTIDAILDQMLKSGTGGQQEGGEDKGAAMEQAKAEAEMQIMQAEAQMAREKHQADMQMKQADMQMKQQLAVLEFEHKKRMYELELMATQARENQKAQIAAATFERETAQDDARAAAGIAAQQLKVEANIADKRAREE